MPGKRRFRMAWTVCGFAAGLAVLFLIWRLIIQDPNALPKSDWKTYKREFIHPSGRVIDTGNGDVSHSEGQGYGMLFAEAFGDRRTFEKIWAWTRANLQTRPDDKLLSWIWKPKSEDTPEGVGDPNNASDGDLLVAWALLRAADRWNEYAFKQAAVQILVDLKRLDVMEANGLQVLLPGTDGFTEKEGGIVLNPSYYVFPALNAAARAMPQAGWEAIARDGLKIISASRFGIYHLCADWIQLGEEIRIAPDFPPDFGYNAVRVPLNIAWGNTHPDLLEPFAAFWEALPIPRPATVNLQTNAFGPHPALPGMEAIATLSIARFHRQPLTVSGIPRIKADESYYSASLKLLTKIAIRDSLEAPTP